MEETSVENLQYIPETTNKLAIPNDAKLLNCFKTYKVSRETQKLASEQGRQIFAEAFIEDGDLRWLSEICIAALGKIFGPAKLPAEINKDPLKIRIFYDSLSVDLPLKQSYCINDLLYWKRTLLAKTQNKSLHFKKNVNWKNRAITEKLENELETHTVQYFPTEEFYVLSQKIKPYITDLHIKHLESLPESYFDRFKKVNDNEYNSSEEELSEDDFLEFSESEPEAEEEMGSEESESLTWIKNASLNVASVNVVLHETNSQLQLNKLENELSQAKTATLHARQERRHKFEERKELREKLKYKKKLIHEETLEETKKKTKNNYKSLFDIPLESEENEEELVNFPALVDKRNPELLFEQQKRTNFPYKHCHHIDFTFLNWFTHLETLCLEFQGPRLIKDFHQGHFNFSYKDMRNLAAGIAPLSNLRVFRLRNSRMNAKKLHIILNTLKKMDCIQVLDLGYNGLMDDCGLVMYLYMQNAKGLLSLELESNRFRADFLIKLAYGIYLCEGPKLEYLGLARNILPHEGFHELMMILCKTDNVKSLNLTAAMLENKSISCCISTEIIPKHKTMKEINLMAVPIDYETSEALRIALEANKTLVQLNIRGCDLEYEMEYEIEVILRRNRHIKKNPLIGKTDLTEEDIKEHLNKQMNPIYARALKKVEKQMKCLNNRPKEYASKAMILRKPTVEFERTSDSGISQLSLNHRYPFVFDCNTFDEKQIFKHVHEPGPVERYFYMQKQRRSKHEIDIYHI